MRLNGIRPSGGFCIVAAFMLLLVPLPWLVAFIFAAVIHELFHYAAIRICTGDRQSLRLYTYCAYLRLPEMSRGREMICALAGPIGGLLLLFLARWFPRLAICGGIQSAYNLLPIYPLDGGRALQSGLLLFLPPPLANRICNWMALICKWSLCMLAIYGSFGLKLGVFPLIMVALLLIRVK